MSIMISDRKEIDFVGCSATMGDLRMNKTFSEHIWDFSWSDYFPIVLNDADIVVEKSSDEDVLKFARENFATIYGSEFNKSSFLWFDTSEPKNTYYKIAGDFFVFKDGQKTIGVFVGTPLDWGTYYLRNVSILPEYQGRKIYQKFLRRFLNYLEELNLERIEGEISPANSASIHVLLKFGFTISGINLSERWGTLLKFVKYTSLKHHEVFFKQFCHSRIPEMERKYSGFIANHTK